MHKQKSKCLKVFVFQVIKFFWCKREAFTTPPDTGVVLVVSRVSLFSPYNFRRYFSRTVKEPAGFLRGQSRVKGNLYLYKLKLPFSVFWLTGYNLENVVQAWCLNEVVTCSFQFVLLDCKSVLSSDDEVVPHRIKFILLHLCCVFHLLRLRPNTHLIFEWAQ